MVRHIEQLQSLTDSARLAGSLAVEAGRYARTPDFTKPAATSSRPSSDRGTTFHFAHKVMSKRSDMSDGNSTHTTSASHQGYIERPSATEEITSDIARVINRAPMPVIEDGLIADGFIYPQRLVDGTRASFGTIGNTKAARKAFWNEIETSEGKSARVQGRIIAELPVELDLTQRCLVARDFCQSFEERGLPYWAAIHAPGARNDARNFHLHITYFDRPTGRNAQGEWAHSLVEVRRKKSRHQVECHPYRSNKHADTRGRDWPKRLRRNYADTCNFHLAMGGFEKRYDPRSYKDSGILKEPTEHLGTKIAALETMGLDTVPGQRNAKREIRWMVTKIEAPWVARAKTLRSSDAFDRPQVAEQQSSLVSLAETGITHARKSASFQIMANMITLRAEERFNFLSTEITRLQSKDDMSDLARRSAVIIALSAEQDLLLERMPALQMTATKCRKIGEDEMIKSRKKIAKFDQQIALFDPDLLLDSDDLTDIRDLAPDDMSDVAQGKPSDLDADDLKNIDDLFPDIPRDMTPVGETLPNDAADLLQDNEEGRPRETEKHQDDRKVAITRIDQIVAALMSPDQAAEMRDDHKIDAEAFPGAWSIQPTREKEKLVQLDKMLAELDNRQLRQAAIASRDATDLCQAGSARDDFARGWAVLRHEAGRRGLDLDTGQHVPETATDADRAHLHVDQDPCPIRVVRKNIARQRVRV